MSISNYVGVCGSCGKRSYSDRKAARSAARRLHPGESMRAYACPAETGYYHYGHLPSSVALGRRPESLRPDARAIASTRRIAESIVRAQIVDARADAIERLTMPVSMGKLGAEYNRRRRARIRRNRRN